MGVPLNLDELANHIVDAVVKEGKSVVLEAYPGFGKTRLAATIASKTDRVLVAVRTHNEIFEVYRFLPSSVKAVYAYGKPKICFKLQQFSYKTCRTMSLFGKCSMEFNHKDVAWLAATLRKPSEIVEYEKKRNKCLYNAIKSLAMKSKKVVTTYDYIVSNPQILEDRDILVFDEAHHLLSYVDELVVELTPSFIESIVAELKRNIETRPLAYSIRAAYRKSKTLREFVEKLTAILGAVDQDHEMIRLLDKIISAFFKNWYYVNGSTAMLLTDTIPKLARAGNKVMLGVYLPPLFLMDKNVEHISIEAEPRIEAVVDSAVTTKYTERDENMYKELAKRIENYVSKSCGNLAVFPSYHVMREVMNYLGSIEERVLLPGEKIDEVPSGSVLADVAGGRYTEGVNLRNVCNVIVVGMPFPEPTPVLDLLSKVFGFENVYTYIALLRTYQAVGRIRERGTAYLLDSRFARYKDKFPKWMVVRDVV
jgi:Rad3-related DNA helicase